MNYVLSENTANRLRTLLSTSGSGVIGGVEAIAEPGPSFRDETFYRNQLHIRLSAIRQFSNDDIQREATNLAIANGDEICVDVNIPIGSYFRFCHSVDALGTRNMNPGVDIVNDALYGPGVYSKSSAPSEANPLQAKLNVWVRSHTRIPKVPENASDDWYADYSIIIVKDDVALANRVQNLWYFQTPPLVSVYCLSAYRFPSSSLGGGISELAASPSYLFETYPEKYVQVRTIGVIRRTKYAVQFYPSHPPIDTYRQSDNCFVYVGYRGEITPEGTDNEPPKVFFVQNDWSSANSDNKWLASSMVADGESHAVGVHTFITLPSFGSITPSVIYPLVDYTMDKNIEYDDFVTRYDSDTMSIADVPIMPIIQVNQTDLLVSNIIYKGDINTGSQAGLDSLWLSNNAVLLGIPFEFDLSDGNSDSKNVWGWRFALYPKMPESGLFKTFHTFNFSMEGAPGYNYTKVRNNIRVMDPNSSSESYNQYPFVRIWLNNDDVSVESFILDSDTPSKDDENKTYSQVFKEWLADRGNGEDRELDYIWGWVDDEESGKFQVGKILPESVNKWFKIFAWGAEIWIDSGFNSSMGMGFRPFQITPEGKIINCYFQNGIRLYKGLDINYDLTGKTGILWAVLDTITFDNNNPGNIGSCIWHPVLQNQSSGTGAWEMPLYELDNGSVKVDLRFIALEKYK